MSLITQTIPALFNGVSQQPATLRLPSQGEAQINAYGTVVDGLRKRPAMQHVAQVSSSAMSSGFIHSINRDTSERYIVVITDGDLEVYDLTGTQKTVNFPTRPDWAATTAYTVGDSVLPLTPNGYMYRCTVAGTSDGSEPTWPTTIGGTVVDDGVTWQCLQDYLSSTTPSDDFAAVTVADYTFIVNKSVLVRRRGTGTDNALPAQHNQYGEEIWRNGELVEEQFFNSETGALTGTVQTFSDLPKASDPAPPSNGDIYKIAGYDQDSFGVYYVVRTGGVWEETVKPSLNNALDEFTLIHALVRNTGGDFTFKPFKWAVRRVGDDTTNPKPTFLGRTINDVFFYKNRLGFVADENVIFSGAGDFGNFWRTTVTDLLDSDVVDVAVSHTKVSILNYAVPFNNNLMLFADQSQFSLNVDQLLTPTSVSVDTVTDFEMNVRARPVGIGNDIYFVTETGSFSRIREYFVQEGDANSTDAADVTAHVPEFLPQGVYKLAGNGNEDVLFAISDNSGDRNKLYTYKFFWNEDGKVQSAWSYWEIEDAGNTKILHIEVLEHELYLLIQRDDGTFLEKVNLQSGAVTGSLTFEVLLDRLTSVTGTYSAGPDYTEFVIPYDVQDQANFKLVKGAAFTDAKGQLLDTTAYTWVDDTHVRVPDDQTAGVVWMGQNYDMEYTFSEQFVRNGEKAVTTGRFQLRTFTLYFHDTAFFNTSVAPYGNDPLVEDVVPASLSDFTGKNLGEASLVTGEPVFHTGQYAFQIYGNSRVAVVKLTSPTHVQSKFDQAEVEGFYTNRAQAR